MSRNGVTLESLQEQLFSLMSTMNQNNAVMTKLNRALSDRINSVEEKVHSDVASILMKITEQQLRLAEEIKSLKTTIKQ